MNNTGKIIYFEDNGITAEAAIENIKKMEAEVDEKIKAIPGGEFLEKRFERMINKSLGYSEEEARDPEVWEQRKRRMQEGKELLNHSDIN